jgi:branched-chain amino acid transport system ATP-binding protein
MNLIEVKGLEAFYGDMQALFGLDFTLANKECLALVGANGAGKSTILRCLTGLNKKIKGDIIYDGASTVKTCRAPASLWCRKDACCLPR